MSDRYTDADERNDNSGRQWEAPMNAPTVPEMKALGPSSPKSEDTHRAAEGAVVADLDPHLKTNEPGDFKLMHSVVAGQCHRCGRWPGAYPSSECPGEGPHIAQLRDLSRGVRTGVATIPCQEAAVSTAEQVGIGPLADEPKIVPAPTEKGDGVVVVPREPTGPMLVAGMRAHDSFRGAGTVGALNAERNVVEIWSAMIAATQQATGGEGPEIALEDAERYGIGFIVDGQRVSPDRVTVCHGQQAPEGVGETWESMAAWGEETFGPASNARIAERANEEMVELLADPDDIEEAADVCIVLSKYPGIREAINRKMAVNRARQWNLKGDGTGYHVKPDASQDQG